MIVYNKEQKEEFIKDYLKSRVVAKTSLYSLFRKIEPFEQKSQKDCSEFNTEEILKTYKEFKAKSKFTVLNYNTILKAYYAWTKYYYNNTNSSGYDGITADMISELISKDASKILSREDILDIEDDLYNYFDKAIVELLFLGVSGKNMEDIYSVSEDCVKGDLLIVNGKKFPMTDRLKELLPKAFTETEIMSYGDTMKTIQVVGYGRIYKERSNARGVDSDDAKFRYFYRRIQLIRNYLNVPGLTMKNIATSGLWYYLQCNMAETKLDLRQFLKTQKGKELAIQYGFSEDYYIENICAKYEQYLK